MPPDMKLPERFPPEFCYPALIPVNTPKIKGGLLILLVGLFFVT